MRRIELASPMLDEDEVEAAALAIRSGWVTQGPRVAQFEQEFAASTGAAHACAVSSCTSALHLALLAVGVCPGDVVLTVSHSFIATANAVRYCLAEPVFVDIDPATLNMDPRCLDQALREDFDRGREGVPVYRHSERFVAGSGPWRHLKQPSGRLGAILVVHQVGMPADLDGIMPIARRAGIPVVEDAACAAGSQADYGRGWEPIGRPHGDIACFSFHPRKVLTTGDGGMITTASADLDQRCRLLRQHAMNVSDLARHAAQDVVFEEYPETGFNYRLTDVQAAIGMVQLRKLAQAVSARRALAAEYREALASIEGLRVPAEPAFARSNWQSYVVGLPPGTEQRGLMMRLKAKGVATRRGVMCAHLEAAFAAAWPAGSLPHSERARDEAVVLPLHGRMTGEDVAYVARAMKAAILG